MQSRLLGRGEFEGGQSGAEDAESSRLLWTVEGPSYFSFLAFLHKQTTIDALLGNLWMVTSKGAPASMFRMFAFPAGDEFAVIATNFASEGGRRDVPKPDAACRDEKVALVIPYMMCVLDKIGISTDESDGQMNSQVFSWVLCLAQTFSKASDIMTPLSPTRLTPHPKRDNTIYKKLRDLNSTL